MKKGCPTPGKHLQCRAKTRFNLRRISTTFSMGRSLEKLWPTDIGKASRGKLCDNHVVSSAGTVANQQFSNVIPANDNADMGGVGE